MYVLDIGCVLAGEKIHGKYLGFDFFFLITASFPNPWAISPAFPLGLPSPFGTVKESAL